MEPDEFIKAVCRSRQWAFCLLEGESHQIKGDRYPGALLPKMSFGPQSHLDCLILHGPL